MMCYLVADHSTENTAEGGTDHLRNVAVGLIIHGNAGRLNCNNFNCLHLLGLVDLVAPVNIGTIHVAVSLTSGKSEKSNCAGTSNFVLIMADKPLVCKSKF